MGNYLNTTAAYDVYRREYNSPYFVDKSGLLDDLSQRLETAANYICIIRPRRFGKTVAANKIAAFFSRIENEGRNILCYGSLRLSKL